jgi:hypothetical protein
MSNQESIGAEELTAALTPVLLATLGQLAPLGGTRTVPVNVFANVLTELIADLLVAAPTTTTTEQEIERLCNVFRAKLTHAMGIPQGHA